ncbi:MAG: hypothetical protein HUU22_12975 [Phycisphaerae bacterium]|nr:hypothetical protein [Phycisphaerae bacterium]NUQ46932.1 hypothetical protein [Phycisphaerae bacterium]
MLSDFWDGNWLNARWTVRNDVALVSWSGPFLHAAELEDVAKQLNDLRHNRRQDAQVSPTEGWWDVEFVKAGKHGHFTTRVTVNTSNPTSGSAASRHVFEYSIDQTDLAQLESQIESVLREFPVKGRP